MESKLTNKDIHEKFRLSEFYFMRSDFMGAFAYWVVAQSPYEAPDITKPLMAFSEYISTEIDRTIPTKLTYQALAKIIHEDIFESIPEIEKLNHPKISSGVLYTNRYSQHPMNPDFDFIDLGALARNVFYMLLRKQITQA